MDPEATTTAADLPSIDRLLAKVGRRRSGDPARISQGTLNRNYRVPTEGDPLFARCYRADLTRERIEHEHRVTRWGADRGVPAVAPITLEDGHTLVEFDGEWWSLFPWIDGRTPPRGQSTPSEAEAMGDVHGRIQHELASHPESDGRTLESMQAELAWDTASSLETLGRLESASAEADAPATTVTAIAFQRRLIEDGQALPIADFGWLPCQLLHGDFHDQQVLFGRNGDIAGVVDWELTRVAARVWELLRALSFSEFLETDLLDDYLRGFARHVTLPAAELRAGIDLWWQTRLHTTWVYEAYFLQGNERVASFLPTTDEHLRRFADETWRTRIADCLVAAAAG